ncbi:MAG: phosphate signaling complex protein PhoU [Sandaracinaceae bacterium]|nr:phosphate signaling complex protein PhoU [Sandaracinaceae bacterium]
MTTHTSRAYEAELTALRERLLVMGGRCEGLLEKACRALEDRDATLAAEVQSADREVDADEMRIDEMTVRILALRQPAGRDLRLLVTAIKVVTDLERIGDEATNVAERVTQLVQGAELPPGLRGQLLEMAGLAKTAVHQALQSFLLSDQTLAREILAKDDEIDALYGAVMRASMDHIKDHPEHVEMAMCAASTSKYLERIGDHATNIAEMVVYLASGEDVRHAVKR